MIDGKRFLDSASIRYDLRPARAFLLPIQTFPYSIPS